MTDLATLLQGTTDLNLALIDLCDPAQPQPCFIMLLSHIVEITPWLSEAHDYLHMPGIADVFNMCFTLSIRWICTPRSKRGRDYLMTSPCTCPSDRRASEAHKTGEETMSTVYLNNCRPCMAFIVELLSAIDSACSNALDRRRDDIKIARISARKTWPTQLDQILPFGPENTIRGLFSWLSADFGSADQENVISVARVMLQLTRPLTLPYVVTSRIFLSRGILPLIERACILNVNVQARARAGQDTSQVAIKVHDIFYVVFAAMTQIVTAWMDEPLQQTFLRQSASQLLIAYERAWEVCIWHSRNSEDSDTWEEFMVQIAILGEPILRGHPELRNAPSNRPRHLFSPFATGTWTYILRQNARLYFAERCASPECLKTLAHDGPFKHCGGCKRVLYCSKRCQKTAWQHPAVPHRAVCETLRQFCAVYELARNPRPTPNEPTNPPLDEDTANWILDHFRAQSQYELEHSRMSCFF
jgi:hypothetical protein